MSGNDAKFKMLVMSLTARLGRLPTEDEVVEFIYGDEETRQRIWNTEALEDEDTPDMGVHRFDGGGSW